ncbi:MAG: AAA family ATPase [Smithella sp.]
MINRTVEPILHNLSHQYPVVTLTGPRQSGKTTLCRKVFPDMAYANLEIPDVRAHASSDPRGFPVLDFNINRVISKERSD